MFCMDHCTKVEVSRQMSPQHVVHVAQMELILPITSSPLAIPVWALTRLWWQLAKSKTVVILLLKSVFCKAT